MNNRKALKAAIRAAAKAFEAAYLREVDAQKQTPNVGAVAFYVRDLDATTSSYVAGYVGITDNAAGQALRRLGWKRDYRGAANARVRVWVRPSTSKPGQ